MFVKRSDSTRAGHFERENVLLFSFFIVVPIIGLITSIAFVHMKAAIDRSKAKNTAAAQVSTQDSTPPISLFSSIERVKVFLKKEAKLDYSDKYMSAVKLIYVEGEPKKGLAWVYFFSFKHPRLGGDVSIYHYMDGEIIEVTSGP
jgi:hypothetical protein